MTSDLPRVSVYLETRLKKKLQYIADLEDRTLSAQTRNIVKRFIEEYEEKHGEILVDEDLSPV